MSDIETTVESTAPESSTSIFSSAESFHAALEKVQNGEDIEAPEPTAIEAEEEPVVEEEKQATPDEDEDDYDFIETDRGKMIPKGRFSKEIQKRKALEAKFNEEREARIRYETELSNLKKGVEAFYQTQQPAKNEEPSVDDLDALAPIDPETAKYFDKQIKALKAELAQTKQSSETIDQRINYETLKYRIQADEAKFMETHPDLVDAAQYMLQNRTEYYLDVGLDEQRAQQQAKQELEGAFTLKATTSKESPSAWLYKQALKYGYQPKDQKSAKPETNFNKLRENVKKTSSIADIPVANTRSVGMGGEDIIKQALRDDGSVDPKKFQMLLQKAKEVR